MVTKFKDHPASKHKTDIFDPGVNTVGAEKKFLKHTKAAKQIYSTNKLVFFECYSTGVLECLSLNIPVIFYWPEGLDSIRDESVEDFRELENSQILFFSGVKAAAHVNTIWSDLDVWWESPQVQEARKNFVDKYARSTDCPIRQLRKTLKVIERERW
jgi:putative transferase (TIGR04331 family)